MEQGEANESQHLVQRRRAAPCPAASLRKLGHLKGTSVLRGVSCGRSEWLLQQPVSPRKLLNDSLSARLQSQIPGLARSAGTQTKQVMVGLCVDTLLQEGTERCCVLTRNWSKRLEDAPGDTRRDTDLLVLEPPASPATLCSFGRDHYAPPCTPLCHRTVDLTRTGIGQ